MSFRGINNLALDSKGRMAMPSRYRDRLLDACGGRLVMAHEGGYSEVHVPFCGHAVLEEMSGVDIQAPDPLDARIKGQQPGADMDALVAARIAEQRAALKSAGLLSDS